MAQLFLKNNQSIIFLLSLNLLLNFFKIPKSLSYDYSLLPKLESGPQFSQIYHSQFFQNYSPPFSFSLYFLANAQKKLSYTSILVLPLQPYGIFSLSYFQHDTQHSFPLPQQNFILHFKESAFNFTYQKYFHLFKLQIGLNLSDPVHFSPFQFNGQILPSMNLSLQFLPKLDMLFSFGLLNLFKKSSQLVHDHSESFFMSASTVIFQPLAFKISLHQSKKQQIHSHFLLQYPLSHHWTLGLNLSIQPLTIAPKISLHTQVGNFTTILGTRNRLFFASFAYSYSIQTQYPSKSSKTFLTPPSTYHSNPSPPNQKNLPLVNINTADIQTLITLPGIGPKTAQKIVRHRQNYGPFYSKIELLQVKGIGLKKYLKLKNFISLGNIPQNNQWPPIHRWSMKHFVELGFPPSLALKLVLLIKNPNFNGQLNQFFSVQGFTKDHLKKIKQKLKTLPPLKINKP